MMTTTLVVDSNERNENLFAAAAREVETGTVREKTRERLDAGDLEIRRDDDDESVALFERKTFPDLVASITSVDRRWQRQMAQLSLHKERHPQCVVGVIIEYNHGLYEAMATAAGVSREALFSNVNAAAKELLVLWTLNPRQTVASVCKYATVQHVATAPTATLQQRVLKRQGRKRVAPDIPHEDLWAHILAQVPGLTPNAAHVVSRKYPSMRRLVRACRTHKQRTVLGLEYQRGKTPAKIGKVVAARVYEFVTGKRKRASSSVDGKAEIDDHDSVTASSPPPPPPPKKQQRKDNFFCT